MGGDYEVERQVEATFCSRARHQAWHNSTTMKSPSPRMTDATPANHKDRTIHRHRSTAKISPSLFDKLPPEILVQIFFHLRPSFWGQSGAERAELSLADFLSLSHICSSWRRAALGHRTLWNLLPGTNRKTTRLLLERSGNTPLTVVLNANHRNISSSHIQPVLDNIDRIRYMHMEIIEGLQEIAYQALNGLAPRLETLVVSNYYGGHKLKLASYAPIVSC
jgi:hypothetical protein